MSDYEYIKKFSSLSIKNICYDLNLIKDYQNIINGKASAKKIKKVRKEIERRLKIINESVQ